MCNNDYKNLLLSKFDTVFKEMKKNKLWNSIRKKTFPLFQHIIRVSRGEGKMLFIVMENRRRKFIRGRTGFLCGRVYFL